MVKGVSDTPTHLVLDDDDTVVEHVVRMRGLILSALVLLLVVGVGLSLQQGWIPMPQPRSLASADEPKDRKPGLIERSIGKAHRTQVTSDAHQVSVVVVAALTEPGATVRSVFAARPPADVTARVKTLGFDPTESESGSNRVHLLALHGDDYVVCVDRLAAGERRGPSATYRSRLNKTQTSDGACSTR
jgi:hypothetical protein